MNDNGNTILFYTKEMMREAKESLTSTGFVLRGRNNGWKKIVDTGESFLKIKKDDIKIEICAFNHSYSSMTCVSPTVVKFYEIVDVWCINASLGHIQPKDICDIANKLYHFWNYYWRQDGYNELKEYLEESMSQLEGVDVYEEYMLIYRLADQYINEKGIIDDEFHIQHYVIEAVLSKIIKPILCENDEDDESEEYFDI